MQLIAGSKSKGGALDCKYGGLREQEPAQPVAKGVQGAAGDGHADVRQVSGRVAGALGVHMSHHVPFSLKA